MVDLKKVEPESQEKFLPTCMWPPIRNTERMHDLSQSWATWSGLDMTNFVRVSVAFFIVMSKIYSMFQRERLNAFYKIDRVLPLDQ